MGLDWHRRSVVYVLAAVVVSLGAPMGLLLLRAGLTASPAAITRELGADPTTYAYVTASTAVAFALFAFALGRQADRLLTLSQTDALTGLHNARFLRERLAGELARAQRYRQPLSLLFIDLDGLKQINDRRGHDAGDAALVRVATAVRTGARAADIGARWAGDEFVLLAPNTTRDAAAALAERIRAMVAAEPEPEAPPVTVSIGVVTFHPWGAPPTTWSVMREADDALYEAKRRGRNVVFAG